MRFSRVNNTTIRMVALCAALLGAVTYSSARSQASVAQTKAAAADGRALYNAYCASCHGVSGAGNGPVAAAMRRTPPDITGLTLANQGVFPEERLRRIIDGREIESHGTREMPVWGDAFKALGETRSEESVRARIASILNYLSSIQRRAA